MGVRTELFLGSTVLETTFPTDTPYIALEKQLKGGCWFRKLPGTLIFEDKFEELIFLYITLRLLASLPLGFIAHGQMLQDLDGENFAILKKKKSFLEAAEIESIPA